VGMLGRSGKCDDGIFPGIPAKRKAGGWRRIGEYINGKPPVMTNTSEEGKSQGHAPQCMRPAGSLPFTFSGRAV